MDRISLDMGYTVLYRPWLKTASRVSILDVHSKNGVTKRNKSPCHLIKAAIYMHRNP